LDFGLWIKSGYWPIGLENELIHYLAQSVRTTSGYGQTSFPEKSIQAETLPAARRPTNL